MNKKLNFTIFILSILAGGVFYSVLNNDSTNTNQIATSRQDTNNSISTVNKITIPKKEFKAKSSYSNNKVTFIDKEDKPTIQENNITTTSIDEQKRVIAATYNKLEPATYQEDIQKAKEAFVQLDIKAKEISQNIQNEMREIEQFKEEER